VVTSDDWSLGLLIPAPSASNNARCPVTGAERYRAPWQRPAKGLR
jgi:hypothetical protein